MVAARHLPVRMPIGTPAQRVLDRQIRARVGFDSRINGDTGLAAISLRLSAHDISRPQRPHRLQQRDLRRFDRWPAVIGGRLHRQQRQHLEQVILKDVANGADLLVELAASANAERLRHRDLHVVDVAAFQIGSTNAFANRKYFRFSTGSLPR